MLERFPGGKELIISDQAMEKFMEYDWPGNIRELENVIEYLYHIVGEGPVRVKDLPFISKDSTMQKEKLLQLLEKEMPVDEIFLILSTMKKAQEEGRVYLSRRSLAQLCGGGNKMTEQMVRNRLNILAKYGLVVIRKGPKGTRLSMEGEECVNILQRRLAAEGLKVV